MVRERSGVQISAAAPSNQWLSRFLAAENGASHTAASFLGIPTSISPLALHHLLGSLYPLTVVIFYFWKDVSENGQLFSVLEPEVPRIWKEVALFWKEVSAVIALANR